MQIQLGIGFILLTDLWLNVLNCRRLKTSMSWKKNHNIFKWKEQVKIVRQFATGFFPLFTYTLWYTDIGKIVMINPQMVAILEWNV